MALTPEQAMRLAIEEGRKGFGFVSPNPAVGCVILDKNNELLAKGFHARVGGPHAEVNALNQVKDQEKLKGAQLFVTLEPCAHEGRTPSCAKTLAKLPLASVIYGLRDPNPKVNGLGAEILRSAGIRVEPFSGLQEELEELAEVFLLNQQERRPFVALKVASSMDGKIALANGQSQWITGETSRSHVHYLRGCYDAVLTGSKTILLDDPRLDARDEAFREKRQRLVILDHDGSLDSLKGRNLAMVRSSEDVLVIVPEGRGGRIDFGEKVEVPLSNQRFDLTILLKTLAEREIWSVFVEAGGYTVARFLEARLVDRLFLFFGGKILGEGLAWTDGLNFQSLAEVPRLDRISVRKFENDLMVSGRVRFS